MSGTPDTATRPRLPAPHPSTVGADLHFWLELAAHPAAVPHARRCTRHTMAAWRLGNVADDIELVVSELLTNAVRATLAATATAVRSQAAGPGGRTVAPVVALYLALDPDLLSVLVWDCCPEPPVQVAHTSDDDETGRGLVIIQALTDQWGICAPSGGGKVVWAQLILTGRDQRTKPRS
jgi:hypothetical protein